MSSARFCCGGFRPWLCFVFLVTGLVPAVADGPGDNQYENVRPVPPPGIEISAENRATLTEPLAKLNAAIDALRQRKDSRTVELLSDVEIFALAVDKALRFSEFYAPEDFKKAEELLAEGQRRAEALQAGKSPWTEVTGLVVRGFRSKLDDTVQPYGALIPTSYRPAERAYRCDVWCRGRSEKAVELQFLHGRMKSVGEIAPVDTIVVHPMGRYCNGNKLVGEVDTLEALAAAQNAYRIDEDRIAIRGFSMGGAAAWHLAAHYPDRWFAATPGAGFSETPDFLKVFQNESLAPPPYEKTLWQLYDCPGWARNLKHVPTIAYSGEIDKQKQAADIMAKACWELEDGSFELTHLIGPKTGHSIHPEAKVEIERRLALLARRGRDRNPPLVDFTTFSLKYNRLHFVTIEGLVEHWKPARIRATTVPDGGGGSGIVVEVQNVSRFSLSVDAAQVKEWTQHVGVKVVNFDDQPVNRREVLWHGNVPLRSDRSWQCRVVADHGVWRPVSPLETEVTLRKKHNLQGPIDDAFLDSFLFVVPSGTCQHPAVEKWTQSELERAKTYWQRQLRGEIRVRTDRDLTPDDINRHHLILWGDAMANTVLARIADQLPIKATAEAISVGAQKFDAATHVPLLIYPNPLNREKYVVLNSGLTYREYDDLNNARQVPKLPDWAILDITMPPNGRYAGKTVRADFFTEEWTLKP